MERDDRDMQQDDNATPTTEAPADGPSAGGGLATPTTDAPEGGAEEDDAGAMSQGRPGDDS